MAYPGRVTATRSTRVLALLFGLGLVAGCANSESGEGEAPDSSTTGTTATTTEPAPTTEIASMAAPMCGTDFLARLTPRQRLAQLLNVGVAGTADAVAVVRDEQVGGIFVGSWTDESMLANRQVPQVQAAATVPVMVSIDEEGGRVSRVSDLLGADPAPRTVAQTMTPEETYEMALERGRGLRDLGITVDFAPVVDVSAQPADSVIGDRSFSDDPQVVTAYAGEYADGLRDAGVFPVIKHFPGHGSASGLAHRCRDDSAARRAADVGPGSVPHARDDGRRRDGRPSGGAGSHGAGGSGEYQSGGDVVAADGYRVRGAAVRGADLHG